jgi:hypothetical protein
MDKAVHLANSWLNTDPPRAALQQLSTALTEMPKLPMPQEVSRFEWNDQHKVFEVQLDQLSMDAGGKIRSLQLEVARRLAQADQKNPNTAAKRGH